MNLTRAQANNNVSQWRELPAISQITVCNVLADS